MKKILNLALITILALSSLKANAAVLSTNEVKSMIAKQVIENYKKYTDAKIEVTVVALPFKDLTLPNGQITVEVKPSADKFMARDLEKVLIYVNDKFVRTFNAPVVVKAYQDVLVASCFIYRESAINSNVVTVKKMEVSNSMNFPLKAEVLGKDILAKKAFIEGEVIDKRFIKLRPDVLRNAVVTVLFNTNNLTIETDATALTDGTLGESICVMNKNYNKVYTGRIIGENKVLVKL
jgi:flagella basal body P-ring formation protein FlgA